MSKHCFIGIDAGTSGMRATAIDEQSNTITSHHLHYPAAQIVGDRCEADPDPWRNQLWQLLQTMTQSLNTEYRICAIAIDGTSSTTIACNRDGKAVGKALMYNDQQSHVAATLVSHHAPAISAAHGVSSSLAKAITLKHRHPESAFFTHQADWLMAQLTGKQNISDENNCLKMGYDLINHNWPKWIEYCGIEHEQLPAVVQPGIPVSTVKPDVAKELALPEDCMIVAGTTDSIAAFIASGASQPGEAVTSLGSTLVIKLVSEQPVFSSDHGVYSHRLGQHWLVGGASNSGGRVLEQFFTRHQLDKMTTELKPDQLTGLNYYPLPATGERFPVNDSQKQPVLTPRPDSDVLFFQGILEGISKIEQQGYKKLEELGAGKVNKIFTCGGGDINPAWRKIRELKLGVPIVPANNTQASYGSALLAKQGWHQSLETMQRR